jgi:hypothetical protein
MEEMLLSDVRTFSLTFIVPCVTWTALSFVRPSPTNLPTQTYTHTHTHTDLSFRPFVRLVSKQKCSLWFWRTLTANLTSNTLFLLLFQVRVSHSLMKMFKPTRRASCKGKIEWHIRSKLAGTLFQLLMVLFTKEYLPTSVFCILVLIFRLRYSLVM